MATFRSNMRRGLGFGVLLATSCSALALLASLIQGSTLVRPRHGDPIRLEVLLAAYWAGALVCGALVGLLLPLARTVVGSVVGGALAVLPLYAAMYVAQYGFQVPALAETALFVVVAMFIGGAAGYNIRTHE